MVSKKFKNSSISIVIIFSSLIFQCSFGFQRTRSGIRQGSNLIRKDSQSPSGRYSWRTTPGVSSSGVKTPSRGFLTYKAMEPSQAEKYDYWILKPKEQQAQELTEALGQKIKGEKTKILVQEELDDLIERLAQEKYINQPNKQGKTPLMVAIEASAGSTRDKQREIIRKLHKHGAYLYDPQALNLAIKTANLGALSLMQPYYRLKDLYPEFKKILNEYGIVIKKIREYEKFPNLKKVYEDYRDLLKDELKIINQPVEPREFKIAVFKDGKEQEEFVQVKTVTGVYELEKEYGIKPF